MEHRKYKYPILTTLVRALIEVGFIVFLFYSNLLMGEYTHSNNVTGKTLAWAINDIFTGTNFIIGLLTGVAGYFVFEFLRKKL